MASPGVYTLQMKCSDTVNYLPSEAFQVEIRSAPEALEEAFDFGCVGEWKHSSADPVLAIAPANNSAVAAAAAQPAADDDTETIQVKGAQEVKAEIDQQGPSKPSILNL